MVYRHGPGWGLIMTLLALVIPGGYFSAYYLTHPRCMDPALENRGWLILILTLLFSGLILIMGTAKLWFTHLQKNRPPPRHASSRKS